MTKRTRSKSLTITRNPAMKQAKLSPVHPGEVLLEEFLKPLSLSQYRLAKDIKVPPRRVNEIILHKRGVTADTALRLSRYFGTSPQFWLNLQSQYDLDTESDRLGGQIEAEVVQFKRTAAPGAGKSSRPPSTHRVSAMRKAK